MGGIRQAATINFSGLFLLFVFVEFPFEVRLNEAFPELSHNSVGVTLNSTSVVFSITQEHSVVGFQIYREGICYPTMGI